MRQTFSEGQVVAEKGKKQGPGSVPVTCRPLPATGRRQEAPGGALGKPCHSSTSGCLGAARTRTPARGEPLRDAGLGFRFSCLHELCDFLALSSVPNPCIPHVCVHELDTGPAFDSGLGW